MPNLGEARLKESPMFKYLITVAAMVMAATPALADSAPRVWTQEKDQLIRVDSSDAGKDPNFKSLVRIIKAEGGDHPTIQLSCQITTSGYKALNFSVQLDPENTYEDDADRSPRFHHISGIMEIRDEKFPDRYAFHAKSTKLIPLSREVPARRPGAAEGKGQEARSCLAGKERRIRRLCQILPGDQWWQV